MKIDYAWRKIIQTVKNYSITINYNLNEDIRHVKRNENLKTCVKWLETRVETDTSMTVSVRARSLKTEIHIHRLLSFLSACVDQKHTEKHKRT